jgi:hypothetical protein
MIRPLLILFLFVGIQASAQRLENIRAEAINGGEKVLITYDLNGGSQGQKFKVTLYSSHNNYSTPLSLISGDVNDVTPGTGKKIEWNAKSEMVEYSGDITFELRADPIFAAITINKLTGVRQGNSTSINYSGVAPGETVKVELMRDGTVINNLGNSNSPSNYTWNVPAEIQSGSNYQIKLTAGLRTATSDPFDVSGAKKKIKTKWIIIPAAAVVAGVVIFLVTRPKESKSKDLPTPPDPSEGPQ